jgi:magnesium chelatase family protein
LDRFDIQIEVPRLTYEQLETSVKGESSRLIQERVEKARIRQRERMVERGLENNAEMSSREIEEFCSLDPAGRSLLKLAFNQLGLSARAYNRILKVARTVADLAGDVNIEVAHLAEAIQYRGLDRLSWD